jgi:hypothetical protein
MSYKTQKRRLIKQLPYVNQQIITVVQLDFEIFRTITSLIKKISGRSLKRDKLFVF